MTALRPAVVGAVLRKDVLSLWPLILASLLLPLCFGAESLIDLRPQAKGIVIGIGGLATMALTLTVIHQDAATSLRHDWLTRPIGAVNLLASKVAFLCVTIALPLFLAMIVNERAAGHNWSEAFLASLSLLAQGLGIIIPVFVLGLVTGSLVQAGVIGFGLVIVQVLFTIVAPRVGSDPGSRWILNLFTDGVGLAVCILAIVLVLRQKRPAAARAAWIGGAVVLIAATSVVPPSATIALQQRLFPGSEFTRSLVASVEKACIIPPAGVRKEGEPEGFGELTAHLAVAGLREDWAVHVDAAKVRSVGADGRTVYESRVDPSVLLHGASGADGADNGAPMELRLSAAAPRLANREGRFLWTYDLTLLEPQLSRSLPVDGRRRHLPGVGYCDARRRPDSGIIDISCFKPFAQPAAIRASLDGNPVNGCLGCGGVSYKPAVLEGFGGSRRISIPNSDSRSTTLTLTTYKARGHIAGRSTTGVAPLCPSRPTAS